MRFFIDTEFIEDGGLFEDGPSLLSVGAVAEDGREFYAASTDFADADCGAWVLRHVVPFLPPPNERLSRAQIRRELRHFIGDERPEFWGWCCGFDYVVLTNLMGGMEDWPKEWPYYFNDIAQLAHEIGVTPPTRPGGQHNAIDDARWIKKLWKDMQPGTDPTPPPAGTGSQAAIAVEPTVWEIRDAIWNLVEDNDIDTDHRAELLAIIDPCHKGIESIDRQKDGVN